MTSQDRLNELAKMRVEFYNKTTTDARRVEILEQVRTWAEEETSSCCGRCLRGVIAIPYDYALIEGHCYTLRGEFEYRISGLCEYCFDLIHADPDDKSIPVVGPR